jgi:ribonuclease Z
MRHLEAARTRRARSTLHAWTGRSAVRYDRNEVMRWMTGTILLVVLGAVVLGSPTGRAASPPEVSSESTTRTTTKLVILGSGGPPPDPSRSGPAVAVVSGGRSYLVDFGPGVVRRSVEASRMGWPELGPRKLATAFVTHLHSDHTAGYADLILTPASMARTQPLEVYGPPGLAQMTQHVLAAYEMDLAERKVGKTADQLSGFRVNAHEILPGPAYEDGAVRVQAFQVDHGRWKHAYGYRFDAPDRSIVISGDTRPADAVVEACSGCDVLVHEVYCEADLKRAPPRGRTYFKTYHTSTRELAGLARRAKPGLLVLNHLLLARCTGDDLLRELKQYGYTGKVAVGADLTAH